MHGPTKTQPVSTWMLAGCGIWLIALGLYFIVLRPPLLPEDPRFMGATNFALHSDFRWVLLLPTLVWLAGLAIFVARP